MKNRAKLKNLIFYIIAFLIIPTLIILGIVFLPAKNYAVLSIIIAVLCNIPFLLNFEKSKTNTREVVLIAVMVALTVVSRLIFAPLPSFKPVTAMVIITGIAFGGRAGYVTGAMSALLSDVFFGQGPWTPFQMFCWGVIGFFAGILFCDKKIKLWAVVLYSIFSGVLFSVVMDIWTVIAIDNTFNFVRYGEVLLASIPFIAIYIVSNVVFILILTKPFMKKLTRIKLKFDVFDNKKISE